MKLNGKVIRAPRKLKKEAKKKGLWHPEFQRLCEGAESTSARMERYENGTQDVEAYKKAFGL